MSRKLIVSFVCLGCRKKPVLLVLLVAGLGVGSCATFDHAMRREPTSPVSNANRTAPAGQDAACREIGKALITYAKQGMELRGIVAIFGPPDMWWRGPLDWRTNPDHFELHQWDQYGVWLETGWDDGRIRDMGFGKVMEVHGGIGPGF